MTRDDHHARGPGLAADLLHPDRARAAGGEYEICVAVEHSGSEGDLVHLADGLPADRRAGFGESMERSLALGLEGPHAELAGAPQRPAEIARNRARLDADGLFTSPRVKTA